MHHLAKSVRLENDSPELLRWHSEWEPLHLPPRGLKVARKRIAALRILLLVVCRHHTVRNPAPWRTFPEHHCVPPRCLKKPAGRTTGSCYELGSCLLVAARKKHCFDGGCQFSLAVAGTAAQPGLATEWFAKDVLASSLAQAESALVDAAAAGVAAAAMHSFLLAVAVAQQHAIFHNRSLPLTKYPGRRKVS